jgi:site-specific DNA-methyltransferase (adenine-specific)
VAKLDPLMSSQSIEWETPDEFFKNLDSVYKFTLDVCSTHENAKCKVHYTKEDDGLAQAWSGVC